MIEILLEQGTPDWLAWRSGGAFIDLLGASQPAIDGPRITATTGSVCGGKSPFNTPHQLWQEMRGLRKRADSTYAMTRGTKLEPKARAAYMKMVGETYEPICVQSSVLPWVAASLDGADAFRSRAAELKCPISATTYDQAVMGIVAEYYYDQIQWQMLATDNQVREIDYFSFAPQFGKPALITVKLDEARQAELMEAVVKFRLAVITGVSLSGTEFEQAARAFLVLNRRMKTLDIELEAAKTNVKKLAAGKPIQGGGVMVTVGNSEGRVSWEKVATELATRANLTNDELDQIKATNKGKPSTTVTVKEATDADAIYAQIMSDMNAEISTALVSDQPPVDQPSPNW